MHTGALLYRCYTLWKAKAWDEMLRAAQLAVRADRRNSYAWQQLAIAHYALKDHPKAVTAGRKALELDPKNAYAMCNLALAQRRLHDSVWIKTMKRALKLHPGLALHRDVARALADPAYRGIASRTAKPKPKRASKPKRAAKPKPKRASKPKRAAKPKPKRASKPRRAAKPKRPAKPKRAPQPKRPR